MKKRKIPYALFVKNWSFEKGDKQFLITQGQRITSDEFDVNEMQNSIFCPKCYTNLTRSPLESSVTKDGKPAYFKHIPSYNNIDCEYRSNQGESFNYNNETEARQAIENENLVIVHSFRNQEPNLNDGNNLDVSEEDYEGEVDAMSNVTIDRYRNQSYELPSKITTVRGGICRNFDRNLVKGYYLPNSDQILPLSELLNDVKKINGLDDEKKLYIGRIKSTKHLGRNPSDINIRMTYLEFEEVDYKDFCIKTPNWLQRMHGINDDSIGRFVLFYGAITANGIGLCVENLGFGELSLLPEKYSNIAETLFD